MAWTFKEGGTKYNALWTGDIGTTTALITVQLPGPASTVRLAISTSPSITSPTYSSSQVPSDYFTQHSITGLTAGTQYYYAPEVDGVLNTDTIGKFKTFVSGAQNLKIVHSCCMRFQQTRAVYSQISGENADIVILGGDLQYDEYNTNCPLNYYNGYQSRIGNPLVGAMMRNQCTLYTWDDKDFCGDSSGGASTGKVGAATAFRTRVPSPTLGSSTPGDGIYWHKVVGRVVIVGLDTRYYRNSPGAPNDPSKTMLGTAQKTWFKALLTTYSTGYLIIAVSSVSWTSADVGNDNWSRFPNERTELADFMKALSMEGRVVFLCGDAHGTGGDSGVNGDYATGGGMDIPCFQGGSLDSDPSQKGGPWSIGFTQGVGMYGMLDITDSGGSTISCTWRGKNDTPATMYTYNFSVTP